jgi:hypothetical protein
MISIISNVFAQGQDDVPSDVARIGDLEGVFSSVVSAVLGFAGIALFLMLVVGGFQFITAGGDPKSLEQAKKTLTYAILGMVLVAASFLILRLIEQFTGTPVTEFQIVR